MDLRRDAPAFTARRRYAKSFRMYREKLAESVGFSQSRGDWESSVNKITWRKLQSNRVGGVREATKRRSSDGGTSPNRHACSSFQLISRAFDDRWKWTTASRTSCIHGEIRQYGPTFLAKRKKTQFIRIEKLWPHDSGIRPLINVTRISAVWASGFLLASA